MASRGPSVTLPPGYFIKRELDARNWSQVDLADIIQRPLQLVNEIIAGKRSITPETALGLSQAFDTGPQYWLNLQSAYDLSKAGHTDPGVALRARLYAKAPVKEMAKRGWIASVIDAGALEASLLQFFDLKTLEDEPSFWGHAARKSTSYFETTPGQLAWLFQARHVARDLEVSGSFSAKALDAALSELQRLLEVPTDVARVPEILSRAGIRCVVVEPLPQIRIDGACFWLAADKPCIAMSLRYDRIDYFWYTLMHELGHVFARDGWQGEGEPLDMDLVGQQAATSESKPPFEQNADQFAVSQLVPQDELANFIARSRPHYSRAKILAFAQRFNVHPGIVVGQLQHRHEILYSHSRDLLVKVRNLITGVARTDGWDPIPAL